MDSTSLLITVLGEVAAIELLVILAGLFTLAKYRRICRELKPALSKAKQAAPKLNPEAYTPVPFRCAAMRAPMTPRPCCFYSAKRISHIYAYRIPASWEILLSMPRPFPPGRCASITSRPRWPP